MAAGFDWLVAVGENVGLFVLSAIHGGGLATVKARHAKRYSIAPSCMGRRNAA